MSDRSPPARAGVAGREPRSWPGELPELLPFVPLVYVAWADGVLDQEELRTIRDRVERQEWLSPDARALLREWLDPDDPPSAAELAGLRDRIRSLGPGGAGETRRSLVSLGLDLAEAQGHEGLWTDPEAREALEEVERALGVVGSEAARELLRDEAPPLSAEAADGLDAGALNRYLDADHRELRSKTLRLLEVEPSLRFPLELERSAYRARVLEALRVLAREGYGRIPLPEELDGEGSVPAFIAALETLAYGDLSLMVKAGVQWGLFAGSVQMLGTRRHHEAYLPAAASLDLPGCFAMTERDHGSNVRDLETTATWDGERREFVIHTPHEGARKDWIGNAALHGRLATVFARLRVGDDDHGVHAFLVPLRDGEGRPLEGVRIEDRGPKEGLNGVDNGTIAFEAVRIPRENLLDRFGQVLEDGTYWSPIPSPGKRFFTMLGTLVGGRISIAAASNSVTKTALTIAVRYSARRRQFGPAGEGEVPILDYLVQQRLLLPRLATAYAMDFSVRMLVDRYRRKDEEDAREVEALAAGLKAYASAAAVETVQACREACGGEGYAAENRFGRLKADVDVFTTFEGANPVLLQLVARALLGEYRDEMGDLRLWGMVRHLAERAATKVAEANPVAARRTDEEHLRDPEFHRAALRYREQRLLASVAGRLRDLIDEGVDSFEAMNRTQDHLLTLARAHVERVALEAFQEGVDAAPSDALRPPLARLCALFALSTLERTRGWYLESGYFEGPKAKAVRALVNDLCREVRPQAVALVDGFGIPDGVLEAPIAVRGP